MPDPIQCILDTVTLVVDLVDGIQVYFDGDGPGAEFQNDTSAIDVSITFEYVYDIGGADPGPYEPDESFTYANGTVTISGPVAEGDYMVITLHFTPNQDEEVGASTKKTITKNSRFKRIDWAQKDLMYLSCAERRLNGLLKKHNDQPKKLEIIKGILKDVDGAKKKME